VSGAVEGPPHLAFVFAFAFLVVILRRRRRTRFDAAFAVASRYSRASARRLASR
jgi:hypothetical protein